MIATRVARLLTIVDIKGVSSSARTAVGRVVFSEFSLPPMVMTKTGLTRPIMTSTFLSFSGL